jgi:aminoglycoside phosphotransferase (APT) family kinase protein
MPTDAPSPGAIRSTSTSDGTPPWRSPSWLEDASAWMREQAHRSGRSPVGAVAVYKLTERTAFLGVDTSNGRLLMKCGLPSVGHEGRLTALLSSRYPRHFAPVVAVDAERCWLLMEEVHGHSLMLTTDVSTWTVALDVLSEIQRDFAARAGELVELGCHDRTLPWVASQLAGLVESRVVQEEMSAGERSELIAATPAWQRLVTAQATSPVPGATLDHGDLHPGNILVTERGPVFLDWEGGSVGHPFFAPLMLLGYVERSVPALMPARDTLRAAYLRRWSPPISSATLVDAFEACRAITALRYAIVRSRLIDEDRLEPTDVARVRSTVLFCLRTAVRAARQ